MKRKVLAGGGVLAATLGILSLILPNDLGLTGFDLALGGYPKMDTLRTNTKAAADSFLAQHKTDLVAPRDRSNYILTLDHSASSKIHSYGYRSSFYYYCWNIYLPYTLNTSSGMTASVLVHLSDETPGHGHDPNRFHVLEVMLLDPQGQVTKTVNGT